MAPSQLGSPALAWGDHLFTGRVERVDVALLQTLLTQGIIPVIPPLGFDGDGKTYRVNSDAVPLAIAEQLRAIKLIFITSQDVPRVHVINGTLDEGLLGEVFSNHGIGTLIYANEYENIRLAKKNDVRAIQLLTKQAVEADELVKRAARPHSKKASATTSSSISTRTPWRVWPSRVSRTETGRAGELICQLSA
jgi:hypothetical protein